MSTAPKAQPISADPVHVDSKHYTVDAENDRVRVIRARYGPHEKSVMHGHPSLVAVFLTSRGPGRWPGQSEKELGSTERFLHSLVEQHATEVSRLSSGVLYNTDH